MAFSGKYFSGNAISPFEERHRVSFFHSSKKLPLKSENELKTAISFVKNTLLGVIKKKRDELKNGVEGRISLLSILRKEMEDKTSPVSDEELI